MVTFVIPGSRTVPAKIWRYNSWELHECLCFRYKHKHESVSKLPVFFYLQSLWFCNNTSRASLQLRWYFFNQLTCFIYFPFIIRIFLTLCLYHDELIWSLLSWNDTWKLEVMVFFYCFVRFVLLLRTLTCNKAFEHFLVNSFMLLWIICLEENGTYKPVIYSYLIAAHKTNSGFTLKWELVF